MAIRPSLNIAVAKRKNKASEYNENFELMMDYIDNTLDEAKDYVDAYMPSISSSKKGKFLSNDGSEATWASLGNQPFGNFIDGLIITKSSDDTIAISAGSCYDDTKTLILTLGSNTTKQNESQSASTTYYVYIIGNGTSTDFVISTSSSSPTLPTGYLYKRQIGNYTTNSDNEIYLIAYYGENPTRNKSTSVNFPDYTAGVSINGTDFDSGYSAPSDGVVIIIDMVDAIWTVNGNEIGETHFSSINGNMFRFLATILLSEGDTIKRSKVSSNFYSAYFFPMKGAN